MIRIIALSALLLSAALPSWAAADSPVGADDRPIEEMEAVKPADRENPLVRAIIDRDQAEAVRLIQSGVPLDFSIDESLVDDQLTKQARMLSHHNNTPPGYPLPIAAAVLGLPRVLEAIGERDPARLHVADSDNKTAINYAAHQGYARCVAVLLRHGLNPLQPPNYLWASGTPLSRAVMAGHAPVVKLLLEAIPKSEYTSDRVTEQVWGALNHQPEDRTDVLKVLLDAGVSPNYIAPQGGTALINAIEYHNPTQVRLLITHGAKAYGYRYRGRTAHEWAAYYAEQNAAPAAKVVDWLVTALKVEPLSLWEFEVE